MRSERSSGNWSTSYCVPSARQPTKPVPPTREPGARARGPSPRAAGCRAAPPFGVGDHDADRQLLKDGLQTRLGLLAIGDVDHDGADADDLVLDADREPAGEHVPDVAAARCLPGDLPLEHRLAGFEHLAVDRHDHVGDLRQHLVDPAAQMLLGRASVDRGERRIDADEAELGIHEGKAYGRTFADDIEQRTGVANRQPRRNLTCAPVADLRSTALVVVDVQAAFDDAGPVPPTSVRNYPSCEANVAALIAAWRAVGGPIVFVRHEFETHDWNFKDVVTGEPDLLVTKTVNSAFYGTPDLDAWLRSQGLAAIALCGITTDPSGVPKLHGAKTTV